MKRSSAFLSGLAFLFVASHANAQVAYNLLDESEFTEGCLPPCLCPIHPQDLTGTFELTTGPMCGPAANCYQLVNIQWDIEGRPVVGTGIYSILIVPPVTHQLDLFLSIDGGPMEEYSSGPMPGGAEFPVIDIAAAMNGFFCLDYVFDILAAPDELGDPYCLSVENTSGERSHIFAHGSDVVAQNNFDLQSVGNPPGVNGLFFFGPQQTQIPFGGGFRCAGGGVNRLQPPQQVSLFGVVWRELDLTQPPAAGTIAPGLTWNFQFWFRDPGAGPLGNLSGFNLSDGRSVLFQ